MSSAPCAPKRSPSVIIAHFATQRRMLPAWADQNSLTGSSVFQTGSNGKKHIAIALAASWLLVLQLALGAFTIASASTAPTLDIFGNPLCITSSDTRDASDQGMPGCCFGPCSICAPLQAGPAPDVVLDHPFTQTTSVLKPAAQVDSHLASTYRPGNPRAPPSS